MEKLLKTREVADILRISIYSVKRYRNLGRLPAVKVGREFRYVPAQVLESVLSGALEINQDYFMEHVRAGIKKRKPGVA